VNALSKIEGLTPNITIFVQEQTSNIITQSKLRKLMFENKLHIIHTPNLRQFSTIEKKGFIKKNYDFRITLFWTKFGQHQTLTSLGKK
jgi:hypothetical protein